MRDTELYRAILGLTAPWTVAGVDGDIKGQCLTLPSGGGFRIRSG